MAGPMIIFRTSRKLSSYLVRAKQYPLERVTGLCKCHGKRCALCLNVNETSTFTSSLTHETYKINHKFDCNSKCLIYLLSCKQSLKQFVDQTIDDFRFRWNNCKDHNRKYQLLKHLFRKFLSPGYDGFLNDISITFIDKTDPPRLEDYWRRTLKTMAPFGLNIEDSV